jgi:heme exporter protein CcmD
MLKFLAMGGYARYVWPCYALTAVVVGLNIRWALHTLQRSNAEARRRIASVRSSA